MKRLYISIFISMIVFAVQAQTLSGKWYCWTINGEGSELQCYDFLSNNHYTLSTYSFTETNLMKIEAEVSISGTYERSGKALTMVADKNTVKIKTNITYLGELKKTYDTNPQIRNKLKEITAKAKKELESESKRSLIILASIGSYTQIAKENENELHLILSDGKRECYIRKKETKEEYVLRQQKAQEKENAAINEDMIYRDVEEMPSFPEGQGGVFGYISKNIRYPVVAEENGIQGRVLVSFIIEKDGSLTDFVIEKSVDPSLDKEAIRLVRSMPKWNPGKKDGQYVNVKYTLPITFRLF